MSGYDKPKNPRPKLPDSYEPKPDDPAAGDRVAREQAGDYGAAPQASSPVYGTAPQSTSPGYGTADQEPSAGYGAAAQEPPGGYGAAPADPPSPPAPPGGVSPPAGQPPQLPRRDIPAYAFLTKKIDGFSGGTIESSAGAASDGKLGPTVTQALQKVLGWKLSDNPQAFMSALNQSFSLYEFQGHIKWKWRPRTSVAQNDFLGGIAGAQKSLFGMAKAILDQALPLLNNLQALKPDADEAYVDVLRQTAASQLNSLVAELGYRGGPRLLRVNQLFRALAGIPITANGDLPAGQVEFWKDPDRIGGTFGFLRDTLGLGAVTSNYVNSVADEEDVTNFRSLVDYVNAIFNSWQNSLQFFTTMQSPFLGTQLVWMSRMLGVVNEAIQELQFVLDSVFIAAAERETLVMNKLTGSDGKTPLPSITLAELLQLIQSLVTEDGPQIIEAGGKFGVGELSVMVLQLRDYVSAAIAFAQAQPYSALNTDRVLIAMNKLLRQLDELYNTAAAVGIAQLPPPVKAIA